MGEEIDQTLWVGNLSDKVTEELLHELFLQSGPLYSVKIPKEKDGRPKNFAFVRYRHAVSVPYTIELMGGLRLYGNPLKLQSRPGSIHQQDRRGMMDRHQAMHRSNSAPNFGSQWGSLTPPTPPAPMMMGPPWQPDWNRGRPMDRGRNDGGGHFERSRSPHNRSGRFTDRHSNSPDPYNDNQGRMHPPRSTKHDWEGPRDRNGSRDRNDSRDRNGSRDRNDSRDWNGSRDRNESRERNDKRPKADYEQRYGQMSDHQQMLAASAQQWAMAQNLHSMSAPHMQPRRQRRF